MMDTADSERSCVICLGPTMRKHKCNTCAAGAWVVCRECELPLLDRRCPICRENYARAPREWSGELARQAASATATLKLRLSRAPTQQGLAELASGFPWLEELSIVVEGGRGGGRGRNRRSSSGGGGGSGEGGGSGGVGRGGDGSNSTSNLEGGLVQEARSGEEGDEAEEEEEEEEREQLEQEEEVEKEEENGGDGDGDDEYDRNDEDDRGDEDDDGATAGAVDDSDDLFESNDEADLAAEGGRLDLAAAGLCFPRLRRLELVGLPAVRALRFTAANVPRLEGLVLRRLAGRCAPLDLSLPRLRSLAVSDIRVRGRWAPAGGFGLSLSRCPRLEEAAFKRVRERLPPSTPCRACPSTWP